MDIVIVDDEPIFREGVKSVLARTTEMRVVGEADCARAAFTLIDALHPEVVVMNLNLPGMDGIAAAREVKRRSERTRVLILSGRQSAREVLEALRAGASGFALKTEPGAALVEALRRVSRGERYLAPGLDGSARTADVHEPQSDVLHPLSEREREVFGLLVRGLSNQKIARELCISHKTVDTHRQRIYEKLGCHSVAELVRFAALNDLLGDGPVRALPTVAVGTLTPVSEGAHS